MEMKSPVEQEQEHFHVLAVDDSIIDRKLLERLLKCSSYQVTCVDSGDKALEYLGLMDKIDNSSTVSPPTSSSQQGMKVNMIMTDYCMPGMTGYDLLKKVKDSSWKDVPVVVMSSENIPSRITKCLEEGADGFILKPVQLSDVEKLQSHLRKTLGSACNNKPEINSTKRKAMSPQPQERTAKIQRLAVL